MDDIWIISWFNHTAFDANPIWKSPTNGPRTHAGRKGKDKAGGAGARAILSITSYRKFRRTRGSTK